jgi:hypothetical protein
MIDGVVEAAMPAQYSPPAQQSGYSWVTLSSDLRSETLSLLTEPS